MLTLEFFGDELLKENATCWYKYFINPIMPRVKISHLMCTLYYISMGKQIRQLAVHVKRIPKTLVKMQSTN
jgi:hypothetical protein